MLEPCSSWSCSYLRWRQHTAYTRLRFLQLLFPAGSTWPSVGKWRNGEICFISLSTRGQISVPTTEGAKWSCHRSRYWAPALDHPATSAVAIRSCPWGFTPNRRYCKLKLCRLPLGHLPLIAWARRAFKRYLPRGMRAAVALLSHRSCGCLKRPTMCQVPGDSNEHKCEACRCNIVVTTHHEDTSETDMPLPRTNAGWHVLSSGSWRRCLSGAAGPKRGDMEMTGSIFQDAYTNAR